MGVMGVVEGVRKVGHSPLGAVEASDGRGCVTSEGHSRKAKLGTLTNVSDLNVSGGQGLLKSAADRKKQRLEISCRQKETTT